MMNEQLNIPSVLEKLEATFTRLQSLDIMPTLSNMEKLVQALYDLREAYQMLKGADDGRA